MKSVGGQSKDEERKKHPLFEEERKDDPKPIDGKSLEQFEAAFTQVRNYATCPVKTTQGTGFNARLSKAVLANRRVLVGGGHIENEDREIT